MRALRESAAQHFSQGKWKKALEEFTALRRAYPKDLRIPLKIAEVLVKLDKKSEAVDLYRDVATRYAKGGFLLQAIAVNKLILTLDPSQEYVQKELARLYAKKGLIVDESLLRKEMKDFKKRRMGEMPRIPLFSDLTEPEFLALIQRMTPRRYPPGGVIVHEGEEGDSLFVITEGEVDVYKKDKKGKQVWLNSLGEGDFFGEFAFFAETRRRTTVRAKTEAEVQEVSRADLDEIVKGHPRVSTVLVEFYKARVLDTILAMSPLFRSLTPGQRDALLDRFELMIAPEGEVIIREGEVGDTLYIIKSGEVEVSKRGETGERIVLARLKEGDFFGEVALITGKPRTATVTALRPTRLMRLSKADFDAAASEAPSLLRSARWFAILREIKTLGTLVGRKIAPLLRSLASAVLDALRRLAPRGPAKKVLVIEDDTEKRKSLEEYLSSKGYDVTSTESGAEGVEEASRTRPDVILLDPLLPRADGLEALKKLESAPGEKKPPIVLMDKESLAAALPSPDHAPAPEPGGRDKEDLLADIFLPGSVLEDLGSLTEEDDVELIPLEGAGGVEKNLKEAPFPRLLQAIRRDRITGTVDITAGSLKKRIHVLEGAPVFVEFGSLAENLGDLLLRKGRISQETYLDSVEKMTATGKKQGEVLVEMGALTPEGLQEALEEQVVEKLFNCFTLADGSYRISEGKEHLTEIFLKKVNTDQVILEGITRGYTLERLSEELEPVRRVPFVLSEDASERLSRFGASLRESEAGAVMPLLAEGRTLDEIIVRSPLDLKRTLEILYALLAAEVVVPGPPPSGPDRKEPPPASPEIQDLYDNWEKWKLL